MNEQRNSPTESQEQPPIHMCTTCGTLFMSELEICPVCGNGTFRQIQPDDPTTTTQTAKHTRVRAIVLGAIAALLVNTIVFVMISSLYNRAKTERLMAEGKYREAYEQAWNMDKNRILAENYVAAFSYLIMQTSPFMSSSILTDGYYRAYNNSAGKFEQQVAFRLYVPYSDGSEFPMYTVFSCDPDTQTMYWVGTVTEVTYRDTDSQDDRETKDLLREIMCDETTIKLDKLQILRINDQIEDDSIATAETIGTKQIDTSLFPTK